MFSTAGNPVFGQRRVIDQRQVAGGLHAAHGLQRRVSPVQVASPVKMADYRTNAVSAVYSLCLILKGESDNGEAAFKPKNGDRSGSILNIVEFKIIYDYMCKISRNPATGDLGINNFPTTEESDNPISISYEMAVSLYRLGHNLSMLKYWYDENKYLREELKRYEKNHHVEEKVEELKKKSKELFALSSGLDVGNWELSQEKQKLWVQLENEKTEVERLTKENQRLQYEIQQLGQKLDSWREIAKSLPEMRARMNHNAVAAKDELPGSFKTAILTDIDIKEVRKMHKIDLGDGPEEDIVDVMVQGCKNCAETGKRRFEKGDVCFDPVKAAFLAWTFKNWFILDITRGGQFSQKIRNLDLANTNDWAFHVAEKFTKDTLSKQHTFSNLSGKPYTYYHISVIAKVVLKYIWVQFQNVGRGVSVFSDQPYEFFLKLLSTTYKEIVASGGLKNDLPSEKLLSDCREGIENINDENSFLLRLFLTNLYAGYGLEIYDKQDKDVVNCINPGTDGSTLKFIVSFSSNPDYKLDRFWSLVRSHLEALSRASAAVAGSQGAKP